MLINLPSNYKKADTPTKAKRSIFALYFRDGILTALNLVLIAFAILAIGGFIYFATQISDLFFK